MNLNKVLLVGRLTQDPQLRATPSGQSVATLGIATNRVWNDKAGGRHEETEYHAVVVWGKQAEIANQFLMKGSLVFIEGRLRTREWQDRQGQTRKTTEVIAERLQLGPRPAGGDAARKGVPQTPPEEVSVREGEGIPVIDIEESEKAGDVPF